MLKSHLPNQITFLLLACLVFSFIGLNENIIAKPCALPPIGVQVQQVQGNQYRFTVNYPEHHSKDLIFWILPDGDWQYGHKIDRYFEAGSYDYGSAYILKKNDTDFGIVSYPIPFFTVNAASNPPNSNEDMHAIELSSSWSASPNHWVYAIVSITNTSFQTISNGTLSLSYENNVGYIYNSSNTTIPNNWASPLATTTSGNQNTLNWTFSNLPSGQQKYLYVAFDVANNAQSFAQLTASITSNEITTSEQLKLETKNYPHDPNFARIDAYYGAEYDEYDYCYTYSEELTYTVGFQNEGTAPSANVDIEIDIEEEFYQIISLSLDESSDIETINNFSYDGTKGIIQVNFEGINLPGLNQTNEIVSFQESTGYVSFKITTDCSLEEELSASADIVFIAKDGTAMPAITTNTVNAVVGEISSICTPCIVSNEEESEPEDVEELGGNKQSLNHTDLFSFFHISPNPCNDFLTISYNVSTENQVVQINILDIAGKQRKSLLNTTSTKGAQQIEADVSDLESGIYLVNIRVGEKNESYKLVKW